MIVAIIKTNYLKTKKQKTLSPHILYFIRYLCTLSRHSTVSSCNTSYSTRLELDHMYTFLQGKLLLY